MRKTESMKTIMVQMGVAPNMQSKGRNSSDFPYNPPPYLRACALCSCPLGLGRDIYMYRGESAYCSSECRQQQINYDEHKEKCSFTSITQNGASTHNSKSASNGERVAAA